MKYILSLILGGVAIVIITYQGYLFYFADCQKVADYWVIVQTPARCIK